jgi:hypothetical protein
MAYIRRVENGRIYPRSRDHEIDGSGQDDQSSERSRPSGYVNTCEEFGNLGIADTQIHAGHQKRSQSGNIVWQLDYGLFDIISTANLDRK